MSELKAKEYKKFEDIKHIREDGSEFWSAKYEVWIPVVKKQ